MTCISALVDNGVVYMGADSAVTGPTGDQYLMKDSKVFRNGEFVIGYCHSIRQGELLQYHFKPPAITATDAQDLRKYMVTKFAKKVKTVFNTYSYPMDPSKDATISFMVGVRGQIFYIEDDYDVGINADDYMAIGSGAMLSLGSLYTTQKALDLTPQHRLELALEAASAHTSTVSGPYNYVSTEKE